MPFAVKHRLPNFFHIAGFTRFATGSVWFLSRISRLLRRHLEEHYFNFIEPPLILLYCFFIVGWRGKIFIIILDSTWPKKKNHCKHILIAKPTNFASMTKITWFRNLKHARFLLPSLLMNHILFSALPFFQIDTYS